MLHTFCRDLLCWGFCLAPSGLLGHASGHPHGVPFVLGAWVGSTCCLSVSMWFPFVPGGGAQVLSVRSPLGGSGRAWACLPGSMTITTTAVLPWLHRLCGVLGGVWGCSM